MAMSIGSFFRMPDLGAPFRDAVSRIVPEPLGRGTGLGDADLKKLALSAGAPSSKIEPTLMLEGPVPSRDAHSMSPREVANFAYESYLAGTVSREEYMMLGFPAELHPAFDQTIGALTGEKADPDRPRDMIAIWEGKLEFAHKHNADNPEQIKRTQRILDVLKWQDVASVKLDV